MCVYIRGVSLFYSMILEIFTLIVASISLALAISNRQNLGNVPKILENEVIGLRAHIESLLEETLDPMQTKVNRAMSIKAQEGVSAKQLKTAEKFIAQDLIANQDPLIVAGLEMISPRTKEYLEENPELIVKLMPRIQALMEASGGNPLDILSPGGTNSKNRAHPFGSQEE